MVDKFIDKPAKTEQWQRNRKNNVDDEFIHDLNSVLRANTRALPCIRYKQVSLSPNRFNAFIILDVITE
jgi:hypothetical protein